MPNQYFRILHLSDFHWSSRRQEDQRLIVSELNKDLSVLTKNQKVDLLVFSGDLVDRGQEASSFASAKHMFLDVVRDGLGLTDDKIVLCPGNHDVDRDSIEKNNYFEAGLKSELRSLDRLNTHMDQFIEKSLADDPANHRLKNYFEFVRASYNTGAHFKSDYVDCSIVDTAIGKIGLAIFNTAWRSTGAGEIERNTLLLSERAVDRASTELKDCDVLIAIMHHPLDWLAAWDSKAAKIPLFMNFDLVLFGHVHEAMPTLVENTIGHCLLAQSGSLYASREYFNGYQVIDLSIEDGLDLEFSMRTWFDYPRRSFGPAENLCPSGKKTFRLRNDPSSLGKLQIKDLLALQNATDEAADTHVRALQLNRTVSFDESFTCPPLSHRTEFEMNELTPIKYRQNLMELGNVLTFDGATVICGSRESGKTTIALKLAKEALLQDRSSLKIPVNVGFQDLKKYDALEALVRRHMTTLNLEFSARRVLQHHKCLFIVDDVNLADTDRISKLQRLVKETEGSHDWIVFLDKVDLVSRKNIASEFLSVRDPIFILPFRRQEIRKLVTQISPNVIPQANEVETIIKVIDDNKLPRNAYIVTLLLAVMRNVPIESNINEATLLDSMIDLLLNKESASNILRSSTDFVGLNILLEEISRWISDEDEPLVENEVLKRLADFLQSRGILEGAGKVLETFIKAGLLERRAEEIHFRYRSFQSFFLAKYATRHREFAPKLLEKNGIIKYSKEFSLLCDLSRKDEDLLSYLEVVIAESRPPVFAEADKDAFQSVELKGKFERIVDNRITDISEGPQSDSKIDERQDFRDRALASLRTQMEAQPSDVQEFIEAPASEVLPQDVPEDLLRLAGYLQAWQVWGRAISALDFVELSIRKPSFLRLLDHWSRLAGIMSEAGQKFLDEIVGDAKREGKEFTPKMLEYFEFIARVNLPVQTVQSIFAHIGSQSVHQLLLDTYDNLDVKSPEALGATCMLIKQMPDGWTDRVTKFIDARVKKNDKSVVKYFLLEALYQEYYYRILGREQRTAIERLIAFLLSHAGFVHQKQEEILARMNQDRARIDLLTRDFRH